MTAIIVDFKLFERLKFDNLSMFYSYFTSPNENQTTTLNFSYKTRVIYVTRMYYM